MPTIFFYGPSLTREKKIELIRGFTKTASEVTGIREQAFVVYLQETDPGQVGVGGSCWRIARKNKGASYESGNLSGLATIFFKGARLRFILPGE